VLVPVEAPVVGSGLVDEVGLGDRLGLVVGGREVVGELLGVGELDELVGDGLLLGRIFG
jgi:hypothetical protein